MKKKLINLTIRFGGIIACCAFAFVTLSANSACTAPFYEPKAPKALQDFKNKR